MAATVIINAKHKPDPIDLTPTDPDRKVHVHAHPDYVVVAHGLSPGFARGDYINRSEDLPNTSDEHLKTLLANGVIAPIDKDPGLPKSPNASKK